MLDILKSKKKGFPSQACLGGVAGAAERTDGVGRNMK
jgi:hypothetical protein